MYRSLKNLRADVIVFPASGEAYYSLEAKRAGLGFANTVLAIEVSSPVVFSSSDEGDLVTQVSSFLSERSLEMSSTSFTQNAKLLKDALFTSAVSVWTVEDSGLSLLEAVSSVVPSAPTSSELDPLVSVVITSFNRPQMLRQAVASVRTQTYHNIELIVVDDGSTDTMMGPVLSQLEREGVRVYRQKNSYLGAARNNGARVARGKFLVFLDDDNVMLPQMVSLLVSSARRSESKVAVSGHYLWETTQVNAAVPSTAAELSALRTWIPVGPAALAGLKGNVFGSANFLIAKDTFFSLSGFTEDRSGWEDYEFHAKASLAGIEYVVVPEPLMLYRIHDRDSQMSFAGNMDFSRVLRAYKSLLADAGMSSHHFNEREVTTCAVGTISGTCNDATISVNSTGNSNNYLGAGPGLGTPTLAVNGVFIVGAYYSWTFTPSVAGTSTGVWTIRVQVPSSVTNPLQPGSTAPVLTVSFGSVVCPTRTITSSDLSCGVCFHKDTQISYNGRVHSMKDFQNGHAECRVPHVVKSQGVIVHSSCATKPLRLTNDHLVFSSRGMVAASELKQGDVMYKDLVQSQACQVLRVEQEKDVQDYFGLNCLNSVVLADGVKTSTFGKLHTLPAVWFSWIGRIAGIERASRWGDALADLAYRYKLL